MAMTPSARRNHPPAARPAPRASAEKPTNPSARRTRLRLSSPANGLTRVIDPHDVVWRRATRRLPSRLDAMAPVPRQRRDDVDVVPAAGQLLDDPRHHPSGRRRVGIEVRAQHDESHGHASCAGGVPVGSGQRRARRGNGEPCRSPAAALDQLVAVGGDLGEGVGPGVDRRRQHDGGVAGDLGQGGLGRCRSPGCRAPSPRAPERRSPRTPMGTRAPRRGRSARRGRRRAPDPAARSGRRRRAWRSPRTRRRRRLRRRRAGRARGRGRPTGRRAARRGAGDPCAGG